MGTKWSSQRPPASVINMIQYLIPPVYDRSNFFKVTINKCLSLLLNLKIDQSAEKVMKVQKKGPPDLTHSDSILLVFGRNLVHSIIRRPYCNPHVNPEGVHCNRSYFNFDTGDLGPGLTLHLNEILTLNFDICCLSKIRILSWAVGLDHC